MKKGIYLSLTLLSLLFLCSCVQQNERIEPIKTETKEFDLNTAKKMISKKDKPLADITKQETATRQEFEQFLIDIENEYADCENNFKYMFFYNSEFEDAETEILNLNKDIFYPTIYHQGIEVISATVTDYIYEDKSFNYSLLTIREAYVGDNEKIANWYRDYIFKKNDAGNWKLGGFGGNMNFLVEGVDYHCLPFK